MGEQIIYCAWAKDDIKRNLGSSGGVFGVLAEKVIADGGVVAGAAWEDDFSGAKHIIVEKVTQLEALYKSKYVESSMSPFFLADAEKYLKDGKKLLFSGTPCQVSAFLYKFSKYTDQIISVDIICHGTPEKDIWKQYKEMKERDQQSKLSLVIHRKKDEFGWTQRRVEYIFENGTALLSDKGNDAFFKLFLNNIILTEKCYSCKFASFNRVGDITLGDFWGIKKTDDHYDKQKGLSLVVINTDKGMVLFDSLKNELSFETRMKDEALKDNAPLNHPPIRSAYREKFYKNVKLWGIDWAIIRYANERSAEWQNNYNCYIFHKLSFLSCNHFNLTESIEKYGINRFYIYGYGSIGSCALKLLKSSSVAGVIDRKFKNGDEKIDNIKTIRVDDIPDDGLPIVISSCYQYQQISWDLIEQGIDRKRLFPLASVLDGAYDSFEGREITPEFEDNNRLPTFLITGAQFGNKGAQAMLFVTINEIRNRWKNAIIYYLPCVYEKYEEEMMEKYRIKFLNYRINIDTEHLFIANGLTAIIDVSGYALRSDVNYKYYLKILRIAKNYSIPIYLMPQSFGPFDFPDAVNRSFSELLKWPRVIFAREKQAEKALVEKYSLENVKLSDDLVLQSGEINKKNIFKKDNNIPDYCVSNNAVAIIPNQRVVERYNEDDVINIYKKIVEELFQLGKEVYIIPHSTDDEELCEMIRTRCEGTLMPWKKLDCFEYELLISKFQFAIASRYHSIVHAYKKNTPCIVIGWADKYVELTEKMHQGSYCYDVRDGVELQRIIASVREMNDCLTINKETILNVLKEIQKHNCYDCLNELEGIDHRNC